MTTTFRSKEAFYQLADVIEFNPEHYDQGNWGDGEREAHKLRTSEGMITTECGTTHCIAGWKCALDGMYPSIRNGEADWSQVHPTPNVPYMVWNGANADAVNVPRAGLYAEKALGLTADEADTLFDCDWAAIQPRESQSEHAKRVAGYLRAIGDGALVINPVEGDEDLYG